MLNLSGKNTGLDRCPDRYGFVRILCDVWEALEDLSTKLPYDRHAGNAANEDDFIECTRIQFRVVKRAETVRASAADNRSSNRFQLLACQRVGETAISGQEWNFDLHNVFSRQPQFCFVRYFTNSGKKHLIVEFRPKFGIAADDAFLQETDKLTIDIIAAQPGVSVRRQNAEDALVQFEDRNVKGSAAEVVNGDFGAITESVQTVGQGGGGRLIDNSFYRELSQFPGPLCSLALQVVKVCGNGNHCPIYRTPEARFGIGFELLQNKAGNFFGVEQSIADFQQHAAVLGSHRKGKIFLLRLSGPAPDKTFHRIQSPLRHQCAHPICRSSDYGITALRNVNHGRSQSRSLAIGNQDRKTRIHDAYQRVRCSEVYPNDVSHKSVKIRSRPYKSNPKRVLPSGFFFLAPDSTTSGRTSDPARFARADSGTAHYS